jgi:hypothetical protein
LLNILQCIFDTCHEFFIVSYLSFRRFLGTGWPLPLALDPKLVPAIRARDGVIVRLWRTMLQRVDAAVRPPIGDTAQIDIPATVWAVGKKVDVPDGPDWFGGEQRRRWNHVCAPPFDHHPVGTNDVPISARARAILAV